LRVRAPGETILAMKFTRFLLAFLLLAVCASTLAQQPRQPRRKRLLAIGASAGFQHDSISHALATWEKLGKETGLWDTFIRTDVQLITKQNPKKNNQKTLDYFDAVYFYTTGELDMNEEQKAALLSFVRDDGKGFIGGHSAGDTFYKWPEYGEMVGGYFDGHPWHKLVTINVEDRAFPATAHLPAKIEITDEIYQFRNWSREKQRVLMSIDVASVDLNAKGVKRTDKDFGMVWVKRYGKGRVFFNALGHRDEVYDRPDFQKLMIESAKWVMGLTDGDATPLPKKN
jgi:type 1 glutamine amidotransferase